MVMQSLSYDLPLSENHSKGGCKLELQGEEGFPPSSNVPKMEANLNYMFFYPSIKMSDNLATMKRQ
jgi:hypothetical protein